MIYRLLAGGGVQRLSDGACIPPTTDNFDWRVYQAFLAGGGVPLPADPAPAVSDNGSALDQRQANASLDDLDRAIDSGETETALRLVRQLLQGK